MNSIDFKIKNLAKIFDGKIIGDEKLIINGVSSIENANEGDITFLSNNKYSKYLNEISNEEYAKKGLFNGMTTAEKIGIAGMTIARFRNKGILQQGIHYVTGDHYFQRYMYYPEKTKQAIIDGGYDLAVAAGQKKKMGNNKG